MRRLRTFLGVSLITLSVLMLELSLTRLFSATMYYHFAFMAISLALFGSGASGVFIYIVQRKIAAASSNRWLAAMSLLFSLSTIFALWVILDHPLTFETGMENYYRLAKIYAATSLPFFFAGCAVTIAITRLAREISRLYLFDLAGAALGCLLMIPVLNAAGAVNTVLIIAITGAAAAFMFSISESPSRVTAAITATALVALIVFAVYNSRAHLLTIHRSKGFEEANVLFSKWNSFSRITVEGDFVKGVEIKIDADAATGISKDAANTDLHQDVRDALAALVHRIKPDANVLIIGPGGGNDVMTSRVFHQRHTTAVEINPIIARDVMSTDPFKSYSGGIYQQPDVTLVVDEGRSFIRNSRDRFDIIQATMVDTWAATAAGAFALSENNLYTVEAFEDYTKHLTDNGLLAMTRWYFEPPDQLLRLLSLSRVAMRELGIANPDRHVMLIRDARTEDERTPATFMFKRSEFTDSEVQEIESAAARIGFELLYTPLTRPANVFTEMMESENPSQVWSAFPTNVEPTRDNNPFFFNSIRLAQLKNVLEGSYEWQKTNLGTFILFGLLVITSALVILFIIVPLVIVRGGELKTRTKSKLSYLFYFACLGAGFIIVEVAMIQKFILFLGHPVYSLAVVLFSVLAFSAIGSSLTGRIAEARLRGAVVKLLLVLIAMIAVYILALPPIFYGLVGLPHAARIVIAVVLMAPLAMVMGMPMPIGIRLLAEQAPEIIPWAWGINGATSVMGSVGALVIAILTGFNQALVIGAVLYLIAIFFITRPREAEQESTIRDSLLEGTAGA